MGLLLHAARKTLEPIREGAKLIRATQIVT